MNKNKIIFILFVATMLGSTWGAVVNRQKIDLEQQLNSAQAELRKISPRTGATGPDSLGGPGEKAGKGGGDSVSLRRQVQVLAARLADCMDASRKSGGGELSQPLAEAKAQLLGLEKIVDEKNIALQAAAKEKERLQTNMDVLLAKITDQQRELQALQEEHRELVKQLASGKEKGADPQVEAQPANSP